jgi:hypothetical protein
MLQPALVGGLVMGALSALPLISAGNLCCCMWVITGGAVAAYLLQQNQAVAITPGDGALVGLLAGLIGAVVHLVLSIPITLMMAPMERAMMQRIVDVAGSMQPEMRDTLDRLAGQSTGLGAAGFIVGRIVSFMFMLFVGAIFSTVGGLLGAVFFRKPAPQDGSSAS